MSFCLKNKIIFTLVVVSFFTNSCSQRSEPLTMAEQGVAAGAVVGAGLGALVGSTAGEAGAGVVIGSVAGATSGGMIGSAMEGQEQRVDRHDKKLVVNTKRKASLQRSSLKTNLNDNTEEESFLGRNIWNNAPKNNDDSDLEESASSSESLNLPSGSKGRASKYGQIKRSENLQDLDAQAPPTNQRTQLKPNLNQKPVVELTMPKDSQLPKAKIVMLPEVQSPKAKISPITTSVKTELPAEKKQLALAELPKAREVPAKKINIEPVKTQVEKTATKAIEEVKKTGAVLEEQTKSTVAKSVEPAQEAKCAKGQGEIKRATTSASDSDKVFYLRRAILLCPDESSLRVDLAKVYGRLGLKDDAKREFTSAIDIDPSNETAQEELSIMMLENSK